MAEFAIESNGRIEKTAVYYNGDQIAGVREVFLNMDENGTFDAILQYQGSDGNVYSKAIFTDYVENLQTREPAFTEEESRFMKLLYLNSDGDINNSTVLINDEEQAGIMSLFLHIKSPQAVEGGGLASFFRGKVEIPEHVEFRAEITYRNDDNSQSTESIF